MTKDIIYYIIYPFVFAFYIVLQIPRKIIYSLIVITGSCIYLHFANYHLNHAAGLILFVLNMSWMGWLLFSFFDSQNNEDIAKDN